MIKYTYYIFLAFCCFFAACAPDTECRQTMTSRLNVTYYTMQTDAETGLSEAQKVTVDSLNIWGLGNDSILYKDKNSVGEIYLPLKPNEEVSQFVFQYKTLIDTLTIYYTNENNYVSLECGCYVKHSLLEAHSNKSIIDSIAITNQQVINFDEEHIQIFF